MPLGMYARAETADQVLLGASLAICGAHDKGQRPGSSRERQHYVPASAGERMPGKGEVAILAVAFWTEALGRREVEVSSALKRNDMADGSGQPGPGNILVLEDLRPGVGRGESGYLASKGAWELRQAGQAGQVRGDYSNYSIGYAQWQTGRTGRTGGGKVSIQTRPAEKGPG